MTCQYARVGTCLGLLIRRLRVRVLQGSPPIHLDATTFRSGRWVPAVRAGDAAVAGRMPECLPGAPKGAVQQATVPWRAHPGDVRGGQRSRPFGFLDPPGFQPRSRSRPQPLLQPLPLSRQTALADGRRRAGERRAPAAPAILHAEGAEAGRAGGTQGGRQGGRRSLANPEEVAQSGAGGTSTRGCRAPVFRA